MLRIPIVALLLCSCLPRGPALARLDAKKASAVDLIMVGGVRSFCVHGQPAQVKAVVTLEDGKKIETWSQGQSRDGKLGFDAFEWSASYGMVDDSGRLRIANDPFAVMERQVEITVRVADRPELTSSATLAPTFDCGAVANVCGDSGRMGRAGGPGRMGRPGQSGDSSRQATNGEHGGNGQDGGDGGPGGAGPVVEIAVGLVESTAQGRLLVVKVGGRYFLADPEAGQRIMVVASGGAGGSGGSGGSGGAGGSGGSNNIQDAGDGGHGGDGGDGGRGGNGGDGGDGGAITVYYDARFPELKEILALSTAGGSGGMGGFAGSAGGPGPGGSSASGTRGSSGRTGLAGESGGSGRAGRAGSAPQFVAARVTDLFADEIARGIPIVTE